MAHRRRACRVLSAMNRLPRLLDTRSPLEQVLLSTVPAAILGVIAGILLGISTAAYLAVVAVALVGGILAGMEHATTTEGAQRGLVGGTLFGAGVLAGHHLLGKKALVKLPDPEEVEVIAAALFSVPLGMFGAWLRGRLERRGTPAPPDASAA